MQGDGKFEVTQSKHRLTEEQKHEDGQRLFDFCAECLKNFIDITLPADKGLRLKEGEKLPLGFTVRIIITLNLGSDLINIWDSSRTHARKRFASESVGYESE